MLLPAIGIKVPRVGRENAPVAQVLREQDQGRIGEVHRQVCVFCHELGNPWRVSTRDFENVEHAGSVLLDKAQLRSNPAPRKEHVTGIGHDRAGGDEAFMLRCKLSDTLLGQRVMPVAR